MTLHNYLSIYSIDYWGWLIYFPHKIKNIEHSRFLTFFGLSITIDTIFYLINLALIVMFKYYSNTIILIG